MKKILCFICCLASGIMILKAQDQPAEKKGLDPSRLFVGGTFGMSFSSYSTAINISPQVGYFFTPNFAAGGGIEYAYYKYKYYYGGNYTESYSSSYAGINLFARFYPIRFLFLQAQPELDYVWGYNYYATTPDYKVSTTVGSLLLGGGAAIPAGRGAVTISLMYDVLQNQLGPYYGQAIYSFGYTIGF